MTLSGRFQLIACVLVAASLFTGCTTVATRPAPIDTAVLEPGVVKISIVVTPKEKRLIPEGSRIVIADIAGQDCTEEVKDALMRRLIDNSSYDVLTRENLTQLIGETELSWAGQFNTETAAKLGELLGASLWVVGRVAYCGESASYAPDNEFGAQFNVFAILQVIDIETGRVLVSSASEGTYIPRPTQPLQLRESRSTESAQGQGSERQPGDPADDLAERADLEASVPHATGQGSSVSSNLMTKARTKLGFIDSGDSSSTQSARKRDREEPKPEPEPRGYLVMRAADDMANGFADKFFARSLWDEVEMWDNPLWRYSEAIRLVQLGQCPLAMDFMEKVASLELPQMTEQDVSEYLHNYGVTMLCANEPERAAEKLRAAYRIRHSQTTLKMLGLAGKIVEWSLLVEVDQQPEVKMLVAQGPALAGN